MKKKLRSMFDVDAPEIFGIEEILSYLSGQQKADLDSLLSSGVLGPISCCVDQIDIVTSNLEINVGLLEEKLGVNGVRIMKSGLENIRMNLEILQREIYDIGEQNNPVGPKKSAE